MMWKMKRKIHPWLLQCIGVQFLSLLLTYSSASQQNGTRLVSDAFWHSVDFSLDLFSWQSDKRMKMPLELRNNSNCIFSVMVFFSWNEILNIKIQKQETTEIILIYSWGLNYISSENKLKQKPNIEFNIRFILIRSMEHLEEKTL